MSKLNVAVIFGGSGTCHDSYVKSARNLINNLSREKYNIIPVYVNKLGNWFLYEGDPCSMPSAPLENFGTPCQINLDTNGKSLLRISRERIKRVPVDIAFPLLGTIFEGGSVQGVLEAGGIKYVGSKIMASSLAADYNIVKTLAKSIGITCPKHLVFSAKDLDDFDAMKKAIRYKIGYPCYIKSAKKGFSAIVSDKNELEEAIFTAFLYGERIIAQKAVKGRELVCAAFGYGESFEVRIGEVMADSELCLSPKLSDKVIYKIKEVALGLFELMDCNSPVSFKFDLEGVRHSVSLIDIDTKLYFADDDIFVKLAKCAGLNISSLADSLIESEL